MFEADFLAYILMAFGLAFTAAFIAIAWLTYAYRLPLLGNPSMAQPNIVPPTYLSDEE